jgi:hypothetical protein
VRGGDSRCGGVSREARAPKPVAAPCAPHRSLSRRRLTPQGSVGAGPSRKPFVRSKVCPAPHPLQPIVRRPRARPHTEPEKRTAGGGAAGPRSWCAPAWRAPKPGLFKQLARDSRAVRALTEARRGLARGGDARHGGVGREARAPKPVAAPCAPLRSLYRRRLTTQGSGGRARRTGVARPPILVCSSSSRETAAPHARSPKRTAAWCAAVMHATGVSAAKLAHPSLSPRRVRRSGACPGGA